MNVSCHVFDHNEGSILLATELNSPSHHGMMQPVTTVVTVAAGQRQPFAEDLIQLYTNKHADTYTQLQRTMQALPAADAPSRFSYHRLA
jgi:hypothetical protein